MIHSGYRLEEKSYPVVPVEGTACGSTHQPPLRNVSRVLAVRLLADPSTTGAATQLLLAVGGLFTGTAALLTALSRLRIPAWMRRDRTPKVSLVHPHRHRAP